MVKRLDNEAWKNIFRNLMEMDKEDYYDGVVDWVEVLWLDSTDEWILAYGEELFEDGYKSEKEAQDRLNELEELIKEIKILKIVGYFADKERENKETLEAKDVFVVIDSNEGYLQGYCPIGQHFELKDKEYLEVGSDKITLEQYKEASKLFYTPVEYL